MNFYFVRDSDEFGQRIGTGCFDLNLFIVLILVFSDSHWLSSKFCFDLRYNCADDFDKALSFADFLYLNWVPHLKSFNEKFVKVRFQKRRHCWLFFDGRFLFMVLIVLSFIFDKKGLLDEFSQPQVHY